MLRVKQFGQLCLDRVTKDKDLAIGITAPEGDGKSCLSIGLGIGIDPGFSLYRNILFSPSVKEVRDKIYNLPPYTPIIADEAIKIMYKLNWGTKIQKYLNKIYAVCRNQNKISIFNMPRFTDFSEYFRNHRLRLWVHIVDPISNEKREGHAVVMARSWNPITTDAWGLKRFEKKLEDERKKGRKDVYYSLDDKIAAFEELPGFIDILRFHWVNKTLWEEYNALKDKIALEDEEGHFDEDKQAIELEQWKSRTILAVRIFKEMGYSGAEIAKVFKSHPTSVASWLRKIKDEELVKKINEPKLA